MHFNVDCVRDILLVIESLDYQESLSINELISRLPDYSSNDISYSCLKLNEAGFLSIVTKTVGANFIPVRIKDLTYDGHQFLSDIRISSNWERIKTKALSIGTLSIPILQQIATSYFKEQLF